jgi:hypothetical protein
MSNTEKIIKIAKYVGTFAENKDVARDIRKQQVEPALNQPQSVILDFKGVDGVTQSFIHALISDVIRVYTSEILDQLLFKNCNDDVKGIISIVVDYMQQID